MVKLSIIIPYYETYDLTLNLLQELLIQKTESVEIILIDDYCKNEFYDINNCIKIIEHEKNMGVAKSRNEGIELAKGKYIAFIDCDDMITMDYVETLLKAINTYDTDIINFNWLDITTNDVYRKADNYAPWKAIYKKETMQRFREDKQYGEEDVDFQLEINRKIRNKSYTISYLDRVLYIYNSNREGSLFWKKTHKKVENDKSYSN